METKPSADIAKNSKYFLYIAILFVTILTISNITAVKIAAFGPFFLSGAAIVFPISYIFGDVLTEVYGYKASRRIIWSGFVMIILTALCLKIIELLPAAP